MSENNPVKDELNTEEKDIAGFGETPLKIRMIIGLILVFVLSGLCGFILSRYTVSDEKQKLERTQSERADNASAAVNEILNIETAVHDSYIDHLHRSADLMQTLLKPCFNEYGVYEGPQSFADGAVIRIENGRAVWPAGLTEETVQLPENFPDPEQEYFYSPMQIDGGVAEAAVVYRQLSADTYYLEWTLTDEEEYYVDTHLPRYSHLAAIEAVSGSWYVLIDHSDNDSILYNAMEFSDDVIKEAIDSAAGGFGSANDGYQNYQTFVRDLKDHDMSLVLLYPMKDVFAGVRSEAVIVALLVFMILAVLYVWLIATERMVFFHILTKPQTIRYSPAAMRRRTAAAGGFCLILLFIAALFIRTAGTLYHESKASSEMLVDYENSLTAMTVTDESASEEEREWVLYYGEKMADMLSYNPQLTDHAVLAAAAEDLGAEYIMVFDENGNETACSGDYINFTLGEEETDPLYPFRRINKGLQSVINEPAQDIILDKETRLIGWRMDMPEDRGYGVLLFSVDAEDVAADDPAEDENRLMRASVYGSSLILSLDAEKTKIENSSWSSFAGADLASAGIEESALRESDMILFNLFGTKFNGASRLINSRLYYYANPKSTINETSLAFAVLATVLGFGSFVLLAFWLLKGYTQKTFDRLAVVGTEAVRGSSVEVITADGRIKRTRDPSRRSDISMDAWKDLLPENKTKITAQTILFIYLAGALGLLLYTRGRQDTILTYLFNGSWERGFNVLAVCANLMMIAAVILGLLVIRVLIRLACTWLDTKGETILRLLYSLLEYIALFTVLFYSFSNFGIDTSALLTTMGLLSLAVSIGARDLVADVIAGITIVFEGDYQVGDIVEIDGYRGRVQEIGVRSTKIMGMGDNIKTINNRDVRNVINTTRFNSWYAMSLNISASYDLNKLEEILERELPQIRQRVKKVISGPVYRGVESIGKDSFKITILTECREENYRWVQRQVNREIRLLFDREGIPII